MLLVKIQGLAAGLFSIAALTASTTVTSGPDSSIR